MGNVSALLRTAIEKGLTTFEMSLIFISIDMIVTRWSCPDEHEWVHMPLGFARVGSHANSRASTNQLTYRVQFRANDRLGIAPSGQGLEACDVR